MENREILFAGPEDLEGWGACDTCGHWSSFEGGFEVSPSGEYVRGWLDDMVSCYGWVSYDPVEGEDTLEEFRAFLSEQGYMEELAVLNEEFFD